MRKELIILSGHIASGKSTLAQGLQAYGFGILKTRSILEEEARVRVTTVSGSPMGRHQLQEFGEKLDRETNGGRWVVPHVIEALGMCTRVVLDAVRRAEQVHALRDDNRLDSVKITHVHLEAPPKQLELRYNRRGDEEDYDTVMSNPTEKAVGEMRAVADSVVNTGRNTAEDTLARTLSHLGLRAQNESRLVDVLIGAQYGSEGKGHIVSHIAPEYDVQVRVGGANAGHTVLTREGPFAFKLIPSGALHRKEGAKMVLGPGMNIDLEVLTKEIEHCKLTPADLFIDPNAWVVCEQDIIHEEDVRLGIGSTKQGVGRATARRIVGRGQDGADTRACHYPALTPYLRSTTEVLDEAYRCGKKVLLEGTQGTGLSLYHGPYPYVTSRDTSASGTMAEAGIPPKRIRKVILVVRTNPIRVASPEGGSSGPMAQELTWEEVSKRANVPADLLRERERTTTTNRLRRIAEFDWKLLQRSVSLNGPTDIALTFVDYIDHENTDARRFEQLSEKTINFVQEIEGVAACPVSLITTRFHRRSIIDRRNW